MKDYLTLKEISKLEKVSKQTVWRWVHQGIFPNVRKVGNTFRVPLRDYNTWREATKFIPNNKQTSSERTNVRTNEI